MFPSGCRWLLSSWCLHVSGVSVKILLYFIGHPWEQSCSGQPVYGRHDFGYRWRIDRAYDSLGCSKQNQGVHWWDGAVHRQVGWSNVSVWIKEADWWDSPPTAQVFRKWSRQWFCHVSPELLSSCFKGWAVLYLCHLRPLHHHSASGWVSAAEM